MFTNQSGGGGFFQPNDNVGIQNGAGGDFQQKFSGNFGNNTQNQYGGVADNQKPKFKGRQFVPVTLKMIEDGGATDDGIEIDGESVQNVSNFIYTIIYFNLSDRDHRQMC